MTPAEASNQNIALLIDAENAPAAKLDFVIAELASYGVVNIRKAYGNWKKPGLAGWEKLLHEFAIQPVQVFDLVKGKNAADISCVIDAMDILNTRHVGIFAIVSSDCDFTPLVHRLRSDGKQVIGFGGQNTPQPFVQSCSRFLFLDEDKKAKQARIEKAAQPSKLKQDTKLMTALRQAIAACENDEGWATLSRVGAHIQNQGSPFDPRNYGFSKLSDLFAAIDQFEMKKHHSGSITSLFVRDRKRKSKPSTAEAQSKKTAPTP